jgi:hypothetical protein
MLRPNTGVRLRSSQSNYAITCLASIIIACSPSILRAQDGFPDTLNLARAQLIAGRADSALRLLGHLTDSASRTAPARLAEAWVLTGIARFYMGDESGPRTAFHAALAVVPTLQAPGLIHIDSTLAGLFEVERLAATAESVYSCVVHCPNGLTPPALITMPRPVFPVISTAPLDRNGRPVWVEIQVIYRAVIDTLGRVEPKSVEVNGGSSLPQIWSEPIEDAFRNSRFRPGRLNGKAVWVRVEYRGRMRVPAGVN